MLKKIGIGQNLNDMTKEMEELKGGIRAECGSRNHCYNCGTKGNDSTFEKNSNEWYKTDMP